jgi:hypothetical protein
MIIFNFWLEHKHNYFNSQKRRYARAVALVETFVLANRQALKRMKRIRLEKERRLSAAIKIQVSRDWQNDQLTNRSQY